MSKESERVILELEKFTEDVIKDISINAVAELVEDTPIDTSWASSNWIPNIGSPKAVPIGSPENPNKFEQERGIADILAFYKLPANVFISNNVPYIMKLNEGSSTQAPAGFVQNAIAKAVRGVR